ncbi:hypothetical protein HY641_02430 [Candidatus Woesearchaeota archaeon]|nr:hypothetical protein [Candidatus Woesearchaeota archaeon]
MESEIIQYVNLKELSPIELDILNRLCAEYHPRLQRMTRNLTGIRVHVKCHNKQGKRKNYHVHIQVQTPMKVKFASSRAHDWDLARTIHKAFNDVTNQIEHALHVVDKRKGKHSEGHQGNSRRHSYGKDVRRAKAF